MTYNATITYKELAEEVQTTSGIRTRRLIQHWIGHVLGTVASECHSLGEPLLSALCVRADGTVGPGYGKAVVGFFGGDPPDDLDLHAAVERLECYRNFRGTAPFRRGEVRLSRLRSQRYVGGRRNDKRPPKRSGPSVPPATSCCLCPDNATTAGRTGS